MFNLSIEGVLKFAGLIIPLALNFYFRTRKDVRPIKECGAFTGICINPNLFRVLRGGGSRPLGLFCIIIIDEGDMLGCYVGLLQGSWLVNTMVSHLGLRFEGTM